MDLSRISPSVQRQWADDVRYLHSLWHQAAPAQNPNPNPNLAPVHTTAFKNQRIRNKKPKNPPVSDLEWPVNLMPDPDAEPVGWPDPPRNLHPRPQPSEAEQAKAIALAVQQTALQSCKNFLVGDDRMSEDEEDEEEDEEGKAFEFFLGVFAKDGELRGYYERNYEKGEFLCLVCGGIGVKIGKRYGSCAGLVQHTNSISKTKRRGAHRGFGRAVCRVLGWNMKRLPSIVLDVEKPLGQSITGAAQTQGNVQKEGVQDIAIIPDHDGQKDELKEEKSDLSKIKETVKLQEDGIGDEKKESKNGSKNELHQISGSPNPSAVKIVWSGWAEQTPGQTGTQPKSLSSSEEQAWTTGSQLHRDSIKVSQAFLADPDDDDEDEEDDDEVEQRGSVALKFYSGLFEADKDLRNYYEKNNLNGNFICLVCAGIGKKRWKRFTDCIGLVQHANTISNIKKKWAHRAFAKAICQVLYWDINGNPSILVPPKDSLNQSLATSAKSKDEINEDGNAH